MQVASKHAPLDRDAARSSGAAPSRSAGHAGRIGPNAIIRVAEALDARVGSDVTAELFRAAGLSAYLGHLPEDMVREEDVAALQAQLRVTLRAALRSEIVRDAGLRTGDYLLARRIPHAAQAVLKLLPPALAARILARAIGRHAWTFAGSGMFLCEPGPPMTFSIVRCPLCRRIRADAPACDYYAATFERIFQTLVRRRTRVVETACQAAGAAACRFEIRW